MYARSSSDNNPILHYFMEKVGATLTGVKPAELINVSINGENKRQWEEGKMLLNSCCRFKVIPLRVKNKKELVFFFHRKALDETLHQRSVLLFLKGLHYPKEYCLEDYVDFLLEKYQNSSFPHEIGIFLGYPVKDVLGYLGHPALRLTGIKGWRYYGHGKISIHTYKKYKEAKKEAKMFLEKLQERQAPEDILKFWDTYTRDKS